MGRSSVKCATIISRGHPDGAVPAYMLTTVAFKRCNLIAAMLITHCVDILRAVIINGVVTPVHIQTDRRLRPDFLHPPS